MALCLATALRFVWLRYALSAETSFMVKYFAVRSSSGTKYGLSLAAHPETSTAVTILVSTPQVRCAFTHSRLSTSRPYFLLNQRTQRQVLNPEESTAKLFSRPFSGRLLKVTSCDKVSVKCGSARYRETLLKWGAV